MTTKQETFLILTRLACWTTNPAMEGHMLLPLLKDTRTHIEAMQRDIDELDARDARNAMYRGGG